MVIARVPYQAAKNRPEEPLTADVRAFLSPGPIPRHYVELVPDKKGGLVVREPEAEDRST